MGVQGIKTVSTARVSHIQFVTDNPILLEVSMQLDINQFLTIPLQNGLGAYILQCTRLHLTYSDHWISSTGLKSLLSSPIFPSLTTRYPSVEFRISPRPNRHPVLKAQYINGRSKAVCVRNMSREQVAEKVEFLLGNSGTRNQRVGGKKVLSGNDSVRGVWSPMHGGIKAI